MVNKQMKICSMSLVIRKMQIKIIILFHTHEDGNCQKTWQGCGKMVLLYPVAESVKMVLLLWNTV